MMRKGSAFRRCPICGTLMDEVKVRASKKRPWTKAWECPQDGWFEVDPLGEAEVTQEAPA